MKKAECSWPFARTLKSLKYHQRSAFSTNPQPMLLLRAQMLLTRQFLTPAHRAFFESQISGSELLAPRSRTATL